MTTIPPEARKAARDAVRYGGHLEGECPDQPGLARAACWCCVADVALTAALPHIEAAMEARTRTVYSVQHWEDADGIRAGWCTGYGSYTGSRDDALRTLEYQRKTYRDTTFRLASAQITGWKEEPDE